MTKIRLLLVSDLHAYSTHRKEGPPSYLDANSPNPTPATDAFAAAKALVAKERINVDLLVCAGDLCDKADAGGMAFAWRSLHELGICAGARSTIAVCGNHDLDSRFLLNEDDPDPKGVLQELTPSFPLSDELLCDKYWAQNFVTSPGPAESTRLLLVNTSAYHGGKETELNHGRIAGRTIDRIRKVLVAEGRRDLNVLVCHHHPFPNAKLDKTADYEAIKNGQALMDLIDQPTFGPWLVLHGHRHHARITYAAGPVSQSATIGAASFSARISEAANQLHLVTVGLSQSGNYSICGTVQSWTYSVGNGFVLSRDNKNALPAHAGFGFKGVIPHLAKRVVEFVRNHEDAYVTWEAVKHHIEDVAYLNPDQFGYCVEAMRQHGLKLAFDNDGAPMHAYAESP